MSDANGLPKGWSIESLSELCTHLADGSHNPPAKQDVGLPMLSAKNIGNGYMDFNGRLISEDAFEVEDKRSQVRPGDVLLTIVGTIGRSLVVPDGNPRFTLQRSVACIKPIGLDAKFMMYQFQSIPCQRQLQEKARGTAQKGVYLRTLRELELRVAPEAEQSRIVAKIEELFSDLDAGVAALERAQANLQRYRAVVLKAAVEGRLTEEWRSKNPDVEPASELLKRILTERRQKWEAEQLAKYKDKGKKPPENWKEKYKEPVSPDTSELPELSEGWCWATPEQLAAPEDYSLAIGPFGSNLKVSDYRDGGVPLVFVRNIRSGQFGGEITKYVSCDKAEELLAHSVEAGDVLITKMGEPPGDAVLYPERQPFAIITADCIKFRPSPILVHPRFFVWAINSKVVQRQIIKITRGVAQKKVSLGRFSTIALPLAPLDEQEEFVLEIEEKCSIADATESQVDVDAKRAARLRQSILKRAFEGKLVPQDPSDESATVLLERMKGTRSEDDSSSRQRGVKKRTKTDALSGRTSLFDE